MTVSFQRISPNQLPLWVPLESSPECPICYDQLTLYEEKPIVAHRSENGSKWIHFTHEQCLQKWIEASRQPTCPLDQRRIQYPLRQGEQDAQKIAYVCRALMIGYFITWAIAEIKDSELKQIRCVSHVILGGLLYVGAYQGQSLIATMWTAEVAKRLSLGADNVLPMAIPTTLLWTFIIMAKVRGWGGLVD